MKIWLILFIFFFSINSIFASEITIIELHNQSIDQAISKTLDETQEETKLSESQEETELSEVNALDNNDNQTSNGNAEQKGIEAENILKELDQLIDYAEDSLSTVSEVILLPDVWEKTNEEDLNFLLNNITDIRSPTLRHELLSLLNIDNLPPKNLDKDDFDNLVIRNLLKFGYRKKAYQIIKGFADQESNKYNLYYKEFELNYLLSTYKLSEACDFRNNFTNTDLKSNNNYFLKVDIFCLILEEKIDEANLLNALLQEMGNTNDEYFQYLYNNLSKPDLENTDPKGFKINDKEIFLYSAMHRVGNIALTEQFLQLDPINLSLPIILSSSTDIKLRLKAAHVAYNNGIINADSLAALYQFVDFSSEELNNPSNLASITKGNIEMGMAYHYQLSNIQLLPISRLEAILIFWEYAEKNNLELIAYSLSQKSLDTIEPSNELSEYGAEVVKAYVRSGNFDKAEKWLLFSENSSEDLKNLQSAILLLNLFKAIESTQFIDILLTNLQNMEKNYINNNNDQTNILQNEILYVVFSLLNNKDHNPFNLNRKLDERRLIPSAYIMNNIRDCINNNHAELFLSILVSLDGKNWADLHPEHLRLIIIALKEYKNGFLLNDTIMEILEQNKII
ncbi:hypothetical protein OAJ74_00435 [Alphaproteobacteria bacterium]|nr:hypothetical protein [Alphaproteobacteria bacterium]